MTNPRDLFSEDTLQDHDIYQAAMDLYGRLNRKTKKLTSDESRLAAALAMYCGNHPANRFNT